MSRLIDLTGRVRGRWTVLSYSHVTVTPSGQRKHHWLCRCSCGTIKTVEGGNLKTRDGSCGCHKAEVLAARCLKHGHARAGNHSQTYEIWMAMKDRCFREGNTHWDRYGGRGITICQGFLDYTTFLAKAGERPSKDRSIDRYPDKNGNYSCGECPECLANGWKFNVRWATAREQALNRNKKRTNMPVILDGVSHCVSDWMEIFHCLLDPGTVYSRLRTGWEPRRAFTEPILRAARRKRTHKLPDEPVVS